MWGKKSWQGEKVKHEVLLRGTDCSCYHDLILAFTVAELGEMLPVRDYITEGIVKEKEDLASWVTFKSDGEWHCHLSWRYSRDKVEIIKADTEADARGKMLIYLIENNLIQI